MNLIIYYHEKNKYSFNTLIGAIENDFEDIKIYFIKKDLIYELKNILKENEKNILCFSFFTTQIWEIKEIVKKVKNEFGNKIICVAGGPHPTGDPEGGIKMGFDLVFKGEGEEAFIEFLKRIYKDEDYKDLKGICFYDGKFHYTGKRKLINLDDYPPFSVKYNKFSPIEITRGCPFSCYFCQVPRIFGGIPRHRSIESICEYVKILKSKNLTDIRFITPNAFSYGSIDGKNLNISKIEDLLFNIRKIIGKKGRIFFGTFPSEVRPEHVNKETVDLILKYTDNDNLVIGGTIRKSKNS
jgi:B12-binding domain/radical SAM domain protein